MAATIEQDTFTIVTDRLIAGGNSHITSLEVFVERQPNRDWPVWAFIPGYAPLQIGWVSLSTFRGKQRYNGCRTIQEGVQNIKVAGNLANLLHRLPRGFAVVRES